MRTAEKSHIGIDEAGLGPLLGPLCVGVVQVDLSHPPWDPYLLLEKVVQRDFSRSSPKRVVVADSKSLYRSNQGIAALEHSTLAFASFILRRSPQYLGEFLQSFLFNLSTLGLIDELPWYNGWDSLPLPLKAEPDLIAKSAQQLKDVSSSCGVSVCVKVALQTAPSLNASIVEFGNKSNALWELIAPLVEHGLQTGADLIFLDRLGNRRYYRPLLEGLPSTDKITIEEESPILSSYRSGSAALSFVTRGESRHFEVALASLFAKYTRECLLHLFNRYWQTRCPHIKKTAGYHPDGLRFLTELRSARDPLSKEEEKLIRRIR